MSSTTRQNLLDEQKKLREKQKKQEKVRKSIVIGSIALALLIVAGLVWFIVSEGNKNMPESNELNTSSKAVPANVDEYGAFLVSADNDTDDNRVDLFFDPMCPGCGAVDRSINEELQNLVDSGETDLFLTPVAFLDQTSTDNYSTRAVNAFVTVAEHDERKALDFMSEIFNENVQPDEGNAYVPVSDEKFVELAISVGVDEKVANTIPEHKFVNWVMKNSETQTVRTDLFPEGFSTPAVFLNVEYDDKGKASGQKVDLSQGSDILSSFKESYAQAFS